MVEAIIVALLCMCFALMAFRALVATGMAAVMGLAAPLAVWGGSELRGGTPQTVVISREGIVEHVWAGAYGERVQREIEKTFGFALPGLPKAVPAD